MKIRLPVGRTLLFLGAFFLSLIALIPLRMGLDWFDLGGKGLAARQVEGSIWSGALKEAQFGTVGLGDVAAGLRGLPLIVGTARIGLDRREGGAQGSFHGAATVARHTFGFDDVTGRLQITPGAFGALPVSQIDLTDVTARFENGQCAEAAGTVRAAVAGDIGGVSLPGGLTGTARCDAGALLLPMVGQSGMESVEVRLTGSGQYRGTVLFRSTDPALRDRMTALGFAPTADGYALVVEGRF